MGVMRAIMLPAVDDPVGHAPVDQAGGNQHNYDDYTAWTGGIVKSDPKFS